MSRHLLIVMCGACWTDIISDDIVGVDVQSALRLFGSRDLYIMLRSTCAYGLRTFCGSRKNWSMTVSFVMHTRELSQICMKMSSSFSCRHVHMFAGVIPYSRID